VLWLCRLVRFFNYWLVFAQKGLFVIIVIHPNVSGTSPFVGKHPINNIRNGDAIADGLYVFDSILAEQTLKDASDKVNHNPVSLLS
jgi:hypothetical protein